MKNMDYLLQDQLKCNVKLLNKELWDSFYNLNTEMIITKPGRRMFPSMRIQIQDLDPHKNYTLLVEMVPVTKCRYRYSAATGWAPAGAEEAHSPNRFYVHPESPAPGHHWMSQAVSFSRLKLTNTSNPPAGHVVMASMHKYQPRIHIVEVTDPRSLEYSPKTIVNFPETQFIAVTAYQNDKMTKLKIDHNPFAKGFRESGQSKCKRKRMRMEQAQLEKEKEETEKEEGLKLSVEIENTCEEDQEEEELIIVDDDDRVMGKGVKRIAMTSAVENGDVSISSDSGMSDCDSSSLAPSPNPVRSCFYQNMSQFYNPLMVSAFYQQYQQQFYPYVARNPWHSYASLSMSSPHGSTSSQNSSLVSPQDLSKKDDGSKVREKQRQEEQQQQQQVKEVKFTDFSIRAITGFA